MRAVVTRSSSMWIGPPANIAPPGRLLAGESGPHDRRRAALLEAHGVDSVIAQEREAGGHRGMFLSDDIDAQPGLISLLPQMCDAVRLPVVAAGGICGGRRNGA